MDFGDSSGKPCFPAICFSIAVRGDTHRYGLVGGVMKPLISCDDADGVRLRISGLARTSSIRPICDVCWPYPCESRRLEGPHMSESSMLNRFTVRTAGPKARGVTALFPESDAGEGYVSLAVRVGDSGVGNPGYFRPTSVRSDRCGFIALG